MTTMSRILIASLGGLMLLAASAGAFAARDSLQLAKPLQRALGIVTVPAGRPDAALRAQAEVVVHPQAAAIVQAPESGRLRAPAGGWPVPGQVVVAGSVLATLEPALDARTRSQREVSRARLRQRQTIARINLERLQLQAQNTAGASLSGNTYLEQAQAEAATLRTQIELLEQSLAGRIELRAPADGVLQSVAVAQGDVVTRGQTLWQLIDARRTRLALQTYDSGLIRALSPTSPAPPQFSARIAGQWRALTPAGHAATAGAPGWTLWLDLDRVDAPSRRPPAPGELVDVDIARRPGAGDRGIALPSACVQDADRAPYVWLHREAERFERRAVRLQRDPDDDAGGLRVVEGLAAQDRVVLAGAALLSQFD